MPPITLHVRRLRDDPAAFITDGLVDQPPNLPALELHEDADPAWDGVLFRRQTFSDGPAWVAWLTAATELDLELNGGGQTPSALLVVGISADGVVRRYALTFGHGRHLLATGVDEPLWGLRTALNLIYDPAGNHEGTVRQSGWRRPSGNTTRTTRQSDEPTSFDEFGVSTDADRLDSIVGPPADRDTWGRRVTGSGPSLTVTFDRAWDQLGAFLLELDAVHAEPHYAAQGFDWIDHIRHETDPATIEAVWQGAIAKLGELAAGQVTVDDLDLRIAPPAILDWTVVEGFAIGDDVDTRTDDPSLASYVHWLTERNHQLDRARLDRDRLCALDDADDTIERWSIRRCLSGTVQHGGNTFVFDQGHVLRVDAGLLAMVDQDVDALLRPAPAATVPDANPGENEGDYVARIADANNGMLNLDTQLIRPPGHTSGFELCDLLGPNLVVHVKRETRSAKLSHLISQARVSAISILDQTVAAQAQELVAAEEAAAGHGAGTLSGQVIHPVDPTTMTIALGIATDWRVKTQPSRRLPFFTKVNLRQLARELANYRYTVEIWRLQQPPS